MLNSPWYLLLLLVLPWIAYRLFAKRRQMAIRFTSVAIAKQMTRTVRQRLLWLPKVLAILSLAFLVLGLARPR